MNNANHINELSSENVNQTAFLQLLYQISGEISSTLDLDQVLERILKLAMQNVGAISGSIVVLDEKGNPVKSSFSFVDQSETKILPQLEVTFENGLAGWVARHAEAVLVEDTSKDDRWLVRPDDLPNQTGPKSVVSAPIFTGESLVGVITLVHPIPGRFSREHLALIRSVGQMAGAAIRNAFLYNNLQSAYHRYQALFQDSADPVLITDTEGNLLEANARAIQIIGEKRRELHGLNISDVHTIKDEILGEKFESLNKHQVITYESSMFTEHGEELPVLVLVRSIKSVDGELIQWILRDISEQKNIEQLRQDLMAMVYHDIRSPLSTVISSLDLLETRAKQTNDAEFASLLSVARRSSEHIQRLVDALLDIYMLESGQPPQEMTKYPCQGLVEEAIQIVSPLANQRGIEVEMQIPPEPCEVFVDVGMVKRVLINLLENAIRFSPPEGKISVGASTRGRQIEVWVRDMGPGIPLGERERIFEKFVHPQSSQSKRGRGLGLAFCRLAVNAHGGRIWVGDDEVGTSIHFTLKSG